MELSNHKALELNLEIQGMKEILIDKILHIRSQGGTKDEVDILTRACLEIGIDLQKHFREDPFDLSMISCQIVLNQNLFIESGFGKTKMESLKNAASKFIKYCHTQRNQSYSVEEYDSLLKKELSEHCDNIMIIKKFSKEALDILKNNISKDDKEIYDVIKSKLVKESPKLILSETFRTKENISVCSIFLNENLLIQQGTGKNEIEALKNTIRDMFQDYMPLSTESHTNEIPNDPIKEKKFIINQLAQKYREIQSESVNHWSTIEKCTKSLNFSLDVQLSPQSCIVRVNDTEIYQTEGENEYCIGLKACRELVKLFNENAKMPRNNGSNFYHKKNKKKVDCASERNDKIKKVIQNVRDIINNDPSKLIWPTVNEEFLKENVILSLSYSSEISKTTCVLQYDGKEIARGDGELRHISREAAARKLITDDFP